MKKQFIMNLALILGYFSNLHAAHYESHARKREHQEAMLEFTFRDAPIETVLDYLSEEAGLIIVLETDLSGNIDAWCSDPITVDDAVDFLDSLLADRGIAAFRNGRILKIIDQDNANHYALPVKIGSDPKAIPIDDQMVTQIIPVRYVDAPQL